jgi:hypothetical protein
MDTCLKESSYNDSPLSLLNMMVLQHQLDWTHV